MSNILLTTALFILFSINNYILGHSEQNIKNKMVKNHIPKVLSTQDIKIYEKIINLQSIGNWNEVESLSKSLQNKLLEGYLNYEKLMHPNKHRASYDELLDWLLKYNDYPAVMKRRVFRLMQRRAKNNNQRNVFQYPRYGNYLRGYGEVNYYKKNSMKLVKGVNYIREKSKIKNAILENNDKNLSRIFKSQPTLQEMRINLAKPIVNNTYFSGNVQKSMKLYTTIISSVHHNDSEFLYRAGINAYRIEKYKLASSYFEKCLYSKNIVKTYEDKWLFTSCSYWLARLTIKKSDKIALLKKASSYPRTLYGQLALEKLNIKQTFNWEQNSIKKSKIYENISDDISFKRMVALVELKLYDKADLELRNLYSKLGNKYKEELYFLSEKLNLAAAQMRLGAKFYNQNKSIYLSGLYPTPNWTLEAGYIFDKALLFALIRRESAFNFKAKSSKGARGLMQLMPRTASKIKKDYRLRYSNVHKLYSLQLNLELGQKFLSQLITNPKTNNSLLETLIAYNAGISRLKDWKKIYSGDDPLLFIESIPIRETRWFVKYILTDLWIYRDKMKQEKPTRRLLAKEKWPKYKNIDFIYSRDAKIRQ